MTTAQFLELSPTAQREVLIDRMFALRIRLREAADFAKKTNMWNATLDITVAEIGYSDRYKASIMQLRTSADELTEQIIMLSQKTSQILEIAAGEIHKRQTKSA